MNNENSRTCANFSSRNVWIAMWAIALASLLLSLRALSVIRPKTCIVFCVVAFVFSLIGTITGIYASKTRLYMDETFIYCKTLFGREKYLPIDSVTGISTGVFDTICITSASFKIKCSFVKNKSEFVTAIKEKI